MRIRHFFNLMVALLLAIVTVVPASSQSRAVRDRYGRSSTYGDVVEIRLHESGTLEKKMTPEMQKRVRLLHIEGPMDYKDFKFIKKLCERSRCEDSRGKSVDNFIDLELERARIMSSGNGGLLGGHGDRDVLSDALSYASHLRSILLPERLKRIDSGALRGCSHLEEVIMPPGVRTIGDDAFSGCSRLEYISLPEGLERIGSECFYNCGDLKSITIPQSVVEIGDKAFRGTGLKRVKLPYRLEVLGAKAFENTPLTVLNIPATTRITNDDLGTMKKLEEITVENGSRYYTYEDGVLYDNTGAVLLRCPAARSGAFDVPDGVEEIAWSAFSYSQLSSVRIPDGVTIIAASAFNDCPQLRSVNIPASVTTIGEYAFYGCSRLQRVDLAEVRKLGNKAFQDCKALESVVANRLENVPQSAFESCSSLTSVELSSHITTIGEHAFKNCKALSHIELPSQLTTLCKEAFENCALTSLELPSKVVTIGERAFKNCKGLTHVSLPDGCLTLDKEAFRECSSLVEIDLSTSLRHIGEHALRETAITRLVLPETVTEVGKKVAEKCKSLSRIECHAIVPPKLDGVSDNKIELYVPAVSVNAYRSAKNWKNFKNILPLE